MGILAKMEYAPVCSRRSHHSNYLFPAAPIAAVGRNHRLMCRRLKNQLGKTHHEADH
jgi:hypothetical protein